MQRRALGSATLVTILLATAGGRARAAPEQGAEATPTNAPAPPGDDEARFACGKPRGQFEVSFGDEVAVKDLVTWAMGFSCRRFVYAQGISARSAKLTMITPGKLDAADAWSVFEVGLEAMGLAAVAKGKVYEIVELASAKDSALAIRQTFPDGGGGVVRLLLRPQYAAVDDLRAALELVRSRNGVVTSLPNLRALLVTDDGRHVARMRTLVDELDRPGDAAGVWAVPVLHRDPDALVDVLGKLLADDPATRVPGAAAPRIPRLVPDRRVGSIFVVGNGADHRRVTSLVAALDRDQGDDATMTAVRLRNARATEVVAAMGPLVTSAAGGKDTGGRAPAGGNDSATDSAITGTVKLAADEGTNAVLVLASPRDTLAVRAMLDELDAPRRQVYIEAMVLEVSDNATSKLGVSWHTGSESSSGTVAVGGYQTSGLSSVAAADSLASAGSGLITGIIGSSLTSTLLGETVPSFGLLVQATATDGEVEVLASPHLMMLDNKQAVISVGANIPFLSHTAGTTSLVSSGQQVDRQKVALTLTITPHVAPAEPGGSAGDERIRLDIDLEHNQLGDSDFQGLGPTWKERKLTTSVVVRDQDNLVLGGLIDERVETTVEKTPLLGDLPLLGRLFRSTKHVRAKSNLLIVITPHLIDDSLEGRALFDRRMRERDEFLRARSALTTAVAEPRVDYRRKRGVIAEIDAAVRAADDERAARARLHEVTPPSGRIDDPAASVSEP
jgi:general secretion pathway protein D